MLSLTIDTPPHRCNLSHGSHRSPVIPVEGGVDSGTYKADAPMISVIGLELK